jgi:hypothetical protein
MGVESFAETALLALPDHHVVAVEDVDFLAPFKFYRDEPREIEVGAWFVPDGHEVVAHCALVGERTLANQDAPQRTVHFTGRVRLAPTPPEPRTAPVPDGGTGVADDDVYRIYFHGPAYQVLEEAWRADGGVVGMMSADLPPNHVPEEATTRTDPRLAELCFQTAGVWEIGTEGIMALPMRIDRLVVTGRAADADGRVRAVVHGDRESGFDATVLDDEGNVLMEMSGYRTVQLPVPLDDDEIDPLRAAMSG